MDNSLLKIAGNTGRRPVECDCPECRAQCRVPCLGTPDDILKLIRAGHAGKLKLTFWCVGMALGKYPCPVPMVQAVKTGAGCVFLSNGLCELHDSGLKPTEGKLSHHELRLDNFIFELSLAWNVAKEWIDKDNFPKVIKAFALIELYQKGIIE
ncbi:hypothetical protein [Dysgonomonas termitidis]|uniref:Uncharacterized protein n=1 Tax=Dysgonomonas termitidis TaxID=1516126 RepID=A0ABV9KR75_9BACT